MADELDLASLTIHSDSHLSKTNDVAAPIHVSTNYSYPDSPSDLEAYNFADPTSRYVIYSRIEQPNTLRVEEVLGNILQGHAVLYSSGLSAFFAALTHYNPKTVFIGDGYHGCHGILRIWERNHNLKVLPLDSAEELLQEGDLIHLESPLNPTGQCSDIKHYSTIAHAKGGHILIDATLAPPPLLEPFEHGVDMIMHSATKYFGGHSDLLAGVLVTKDATIKAKLFSDRLLLGSNAGNLETWLLLRSLRTYKYRVLGQSKNAETVIKYLVENIDKLPKLKKVYHHLLQDEPFVKEQMLGVSPLFSIELVDAKYAKELPSRLKLFFHATSLGGAESLIEWRYMTDNKVPQTLCRVSIGLEDAQDLINDLSQALS